MFEIVSKESCACKNLSSTDTLIGHLKRQDSPKLQFRQTVSAGFHTAVLLSTLPAGVLRYSAGIYQDLGLLLLAD